MPPESQPASSELVAVRTETFQQAKTINLLKTLLLIVGAAGLMGVIIYVLNLAIVQRPVREPFDNKQAYAKLTELETQLQVLKSEIATVEPTNRFVGLIQSVIKSAVTYWALLAFLFGVAVALYVKLKFRIDYFESYRDVATKKMLSEFYRDLGDRMMDSNEWAAAEAAYRESLGINPTNIQATYGIAKASVFQPLEGQKFYAPEIAESKLNYLIENSGHRERRDNDLAQLFFLKSINRVDQEDKRYWLNKAIEADPRYAPAYLSLGYSYTSSGERQKAIDYYKKAAEIDPDWWVANNNLGGQYLDLADFPKAVEYFALANKLVRDFVIQLNLGDAYRYAGLLPAALEFHKTAVTNIEIEEIENERYAAGESIWSFMPLFKGDTDTVKQTVRIRSLSEKKMIAYYALAFDRALTGEHAKANKWFDRARACDEAGEFSSFFVNRIDATLSFLNPQGKNRAWFQEKRNLLATPAS